MAPAFNSRASGRSALCRDRALAERPAYLRPRLRYALSPARLQHAGCARRADNREIGNALPRAAGVYNRPRHSQIIGPPDIVQGQPLPSGDFECTPAQSRRLSRPVRGGTGNSQRPAPS